MCCKCSFLLLKVHWATKFILLEHLLKQMIVIKNSLPFLYGVSGIADKLVHEGVKFSKQELLGFISGYEQELSLSNVNLCPFTGSTVKELWRPPDIGDIKINFDASFIQDKSLATTTVLARDYK